MMKKEEGITLVSLIITIAVLLIVSSTTIHISLNRFEINNFSRMKIDIIFLDEKVSNYYLKYGILPILIENDGIGKKYTYTSLNFKKNSGDNENYYILDLEAMEGLALNYGEEGFKNPNTSDDVYIINEETHTIYYVKGIKLKGNLYHYLNNEENIVDNIPPTKPEIKVISGTKNDAGNYTSEVQVEIIPGKDNGSGIEKTTYSINGGEEQDISTLQNNIYKINESGNYTIVAKTYDKNGNTSENSTGELVLEIKRILTAYTNNSRELEIEHTMEQKLSNYRIYGDATGIGDKTNLFDINSVTTFYNSSGSVITTDTISNGIITSNTSYGATCNSNISRLSAGKYILSADALYDSTNFDTRIVRIGYRDINKTSYTQQYALQFFYKKWIRIYYLFELSEETEIFGFIFGNQSANTNTLFKNIELRKVDENLTQIPGYIPHQGYKLKVRTQNSRNLFNIDSVSMFYYNDFFTADASSHKNIAMGNDDKSISYIEDDIIINMSGVNSYATLCNSNIKKLEAGTYTLSAEVMSDKDSGSTWGRIGFITSNGEYYYQNINVSEHKLWEKVSYTFTLESDVYIRGFQFQGKEDGTANFKFKNIQLEKGSIATEYQKNNEYEITLTSPLMEGDYIDFKERKVIRSNGIEETIELPEIQLYNEYTKFEVVTENIPLRIEVEYESSPFN